MKHFRRWLIALIKRRIVWFLAGAALLPAFRYSMNLDRKQTAIEAMGWVSHYEENKSMCNFLPDFSYTLRFPGDRDKFQTFIRKMDLQNHKVSDDEYKEGSGEGSRRATYSQDRKGFEIEYTAFQT
jgi:hypothetical protein